MGQESNFPSRYDDKLLHCLLELCKKVIQNHRIVNWLVFLSNGSTCVRVLYPFVRYYLLRIHIRYVKLFYLFPVGIFILIWVSEI